MAAALRDFAQRYLSAGCPQDPSLMRRVYLTDVSTSVLAWREGQFLVELYFMHPLAVVVPHSHPFWNLSIHWAGKMLGRRHGSIGSWLTDRDRGRIGNPLEPGAWHAFDVGDTGAVVYNLSMWDDPAEMNSATVKYLGEPLGPMHATSLAAGS